MFGRKKMYKKGLADAMQAYEAFGKKQEAALNQMREEVRAGQKKLETALTDLGEEIYGIYDYLTSQEKAALYNLSTPLDIKDLQDHEKRLLLATLYQLANNQEASITDAQRGYIRSVQRYLEITNPQTEIDLSSVGNIDSLEVQKTFLQVVLEFFYLQDGDELSDDQEDFLTEFSLNKKQALLIENRVSRLFNAVGAAGIAEKYGYVAEEEIEILEEGDIIQKEKDSPSCHRADIYFETAEDLANEVTKLFPKQKCIETAHYILTGMDMGQFYRIDKQTGEIINIQQESGKSFPRFDEILSYHIEKAGNFCIKEDCIYFLHDGLWMFDVKQLTYPIKLYDGAFKRMSLSGNNIALTGSESGLFLYNIGSAKIIVLLGDISYTLYHGGAVYAVSEGVFFSQEGINESGNAEDVISFYDYNSQTKKEIYKTANSISNILYADFNRIIVSIVSGVSPLRNTQCAIIRLSDIEQENNDEKIPQLSQEEQLIRILAPWSLKKHSKKDVMTKLDTWNSLPMQNNSIYSFADHLFYVSENKGLKGICYSTEESIKLADNAVNQFWNKDAPAKMVRIGQWLYFEEYNSSKKKLQERNRDLICKVSIQNPGEIELIQTYEYALMSDKDERHEVLAKLQMKEKHLGED